jgi:hypothetical protein
VGSRVPSHVVGVDRGGDKDNGLDMAIDVLGALGRTLNGHHSHLPPIIPYYGNTVIPSYATEYHILKLFCLACRILLDKCLRLC